MVIRVIRGQSDPKLRLAVLIITSWFILTAGRAADRPEDILADPAHDPAWGKLFEELGPQKNRLSHFEEHRYFPFRTLPVVLTGEIRIAPNRGLSLSYSGPKPHVMIIDQQGLLLRDERGRERAAPADSRAEAATAALVHILRFDLAALEKDFVIHGARAGDSWDLDFVPRDPALAGVIGTIAVHGEKAQLTRIEMTKSDKQRIEILITDAHDDVTFTAEGLKRFFR